MDHRSAKLFTNGGSQAVRLPAEFRFDCDQVFIRRDERTGDVILSRHPNRTWSEFVRLRDELRPEDECEDFLRDRQQSVQTRDMMEGWVE